MRWGKAGAPGPVPTPYLAWIAARPNFLPGLRAAALAELERRRMESGAVAEVRDMLAEARAHWARAAR